MKRPESGKQGQGLYAAPIDDIIDTLPLLAEFLAATAYEGEQPGTRVTGSILIFCQDDLWKVRLQDKQEKRCSWLSVRSLLEVFQALESRLSSDDPGWRNDRYNGHEDAGRQNGRKKP